MSGDSFPYSYSVTDQFTGVPGSARDPNVAVMGMVVPLAIVGVGGVLGLGAMALSKSKAPPATTSQKIVRTGLLGALVGGGAYFYFSTKQPSKPQKTPKPSTSASAPTGRGVYR